MDELKKSLNGEHLTENQSSLLEALRSSAYEKGVMRLRDSYRDSYSRPDRDPCDVYPSTFCPLGVACEVYRLANPGTSEWRNNTFVMTNSTLEDGTCWYSCVRAPDEVIDYFDFTDDVMEGLVNKNDEGVFETLEDAANWLEEVF